MAIFNEILSGRFNRALTKLFSMKGPAPAPALSSEIMAVLPLFFGSECRFLEGWNRFGRATNCPAQGAGLASAIRFRNPSTSNVVCVIEKLTLSNGTATADNPTLNEGSASTDLATSDSANIQRLDSRGQQGSVISLSFGQPVGVGKAFGQMVYSGAGAQADYILFEEQELLVLPGDVIQVQTGALNINLLINLLWRERALEDSERSF